MLKICLTQLSYALETFLVIESRGSNYYVIDGARVLRLSELCFLQSMCKYIYEVIHGASVL